jgi:hypothetical protein
MLVKHLVVPFELVFLGEVMVVLRTTQKNKPEPLIIIWPKRRHPGCAGQWHHKSYAMDTVRLRRSIPTLEPTYIPSQETGAQSSPPRMSNHTIGQNTRTKHRYGS